MRARAKSLPKESESIELFEQFLRGHLRHEVPRAGDDGVGILRAAVDELNELRALHAVAPIAGVEILLDHLGLLGDEWAPEMLKADYELRRLHSPKDTPAEPEHE